MKIVLATPLYAPYWEWGGVVTWASQLFPGMVRRGHQVTVVTTWLAGGSSLEEEMMDGVCVVRVKGRVLGGSGRICSEDYESACRKHFSQADYVHIAGVWQPTGTVAARVAKETGVPYGISPHGALGGYAWTRNRLLKKVYYHLREKPHLASASWIHATAPLEQEELRSLGWKQNVEVAPNPLDTALWMTNLEEGASWRKQMGFEPEDFVFLSCGRLHHKKGLELLPEALSGVDGPWKWVVMGDDRTGVREELQAKLRKLKLYHRVIWIESVSPFEVRAAYGGSDCLLMPSLHENFGNVAVEAEACGCPAMVSDKVGSVAWLESGGIPRNTVAWKRKIQSLVEAGREAWEVRLQRSHRMRSILGADEVAQQFETALMQACDKTHRSKSIREKGVLHAVVLTLNEKQNLERCLSTLRWCDRLCVVDSGSTDGTLETAAALGAEVFIHKQEGVFQISEQRNWCLDHCGFAHGDWVLFLDADETIPINLMDEIQNETLPDVGVDAYEMTPRYLFWGRWLKRTQGYPNWHPRLLKAGRLRFEGGVWEHFGGEGQIGKIKIPYDHHANSKGFTDWLERHQRYSDWDAEKIVAFLESNNAASLKTSRKIGLRLIAARFWPLRPVARFCHMYFIRGGWLEGKEALIFCLLYFFYEFMIVIKIAERLRLKKGLPL